MHRWKEKHLAVIFGLQRFHQYLFGREFVLVSDHKPLVGLLGEYPSSTNGISENPSMGHDPIRLQL